MYGTLELSGSPSFDRTAVRLTKEAKARCTLHLGATLLDITEAQTDIAARGVSISDFGSFAGNDLVMFNWITPLGYGSAYEVIHALLTSAAVDPSSLPVVEVQLWGGVPESAFASSVAAVIPP